MTTTTFYSHRWLIIPVIIAVSFMVLIGTARGEDYTDEQIVNAIFKAEGGHKAQYPYGIRSIKVATIAEARRICYNTVRNNRRRYAKQTKYADFLSFLASRYCPVGCDNDRGTNKYWLRNVKYHLSRGGR